MDPISVRDVKADGNARIHVGNSSITHVHNYAEPQERLELPPDPFSLIPFSRDPDFVGRGDILDQIAAHCGQAGGRAALVGLGGVGKSQLAIEYSHQTSEKNKDAWLFWVHAGTRARVEEGFRAIADAVKLPDRHKPKADVPQLLHAWLSNERNGKWFMILDSADDQDVFYGGERGGQPLASYLPQSPNGSILVTTRDQAFAIRLTGSYKSIIKVGPMNPQQALLFLEKKLGTLSEPELGAELVSALDCIPLAINQAASYIQARAPRTNIMKYLNEFQESERKSAKLLAHDAAELRRDGSASNAIMKTWQISFDHIRDKRPSAADLLSLMCFFDNQSIPESVLNPIDMYDSDSNSDSGSESNADADNLANKNSAQCLVATNDRDLTKNAEADDSDESDWDAESEIGGTFEDDIAMLHDFCLISMHEKGSAFEMHRLVQVATKKWLAASKKQDQFKQLVLHRLASALPFPDHHNKSKFRRFAAHIQLALSYKPNDTSLRSWCRISYRHAWVLHAKENFHEAKKVLENAIPLWEARQGLEHYLVLRFRRLLAEVIFKMGQVLESEKLLADILETEKKTADSNTSSILATMVSLSENLFHQGRYAEAEALQLQAVDAAKARLGPSHLETLIYTTYLAQTYSEQGRHDDAVKLNSEVLRISRETFGENHYDTLEFMSVLAFSYAAQGQTAKAISLELQVLEEARGSTPEDHVFLADCMSHLSDRYRAANLYDDAEILQKDAIQLFVLEFGPFHPATLRSKTCLAMIYDSQGRTQEAVELLLSLVDDSKRTHGKHCPSTVDIMEIAIPILVRLSRYEEAIALQLDLVSSRRAMYGSDHVHTILSLLYLARCFRINGQCRVAKGLLKEVMDTCEAKYGFEDQRTLDTAEKWALLPDPDAGQCAEAEAVLQRIVGVYKAKNGPSDKTTIDAMLSLSRVQKQQGLLEEAEALQRRVLHIYETEFANHGRCVAKVANYLAETLHEQGKSEEAEIRFNEAIIGYKAALGEDELRTINVKDRLHDLYVEQGRQQEADNLDSEIIKSYGAFYGADHDSTLTRRELRAYRLRSQDRNGEAAALLAEAIEGRRRRGEMDDPENYVMLKNLASMYNDDGRFAQATDTLKDCLAHYQQLLGPEHADTMNIQKEYDDWLVELENHEKEHAQDPGETPCEECAACQASKSARL